jgi:hypothetical protein
MIRRSAARTGLAATVAAGVLISGCSLIRDDKPTVEPPSTFSGPATTLLDLPPLGPPADGVEPTAVVLGDSITYFSTDELRVASPATVIDAWPARTMVKPTVGDSALPQVKSLLKYGPIPWVIALGTNDAAYGLFSADDLFNHTNQLLDAVGRDRCIAWVMPVVRPPMTKEQIARAREFSDIVKFATAAMSCVTYVEWPEMVSKRPALLDVDGVHPTESGQQVFANLIAEAILQMQ